MNTPTTRPCPICRKPAPRTRKDGSANPAAPFCSLRCKDRDLARWFGDGYAVPGDPASPDQIAKDDWEQREE